MAALRPAHEWQVSHWLNASGGQSIAAMRGRPICAVVFQILCPICVSQALPQALRAQEAFSDASLAVIGLHAPLDHGEAQSSPLLLKAFLQQYRIGFPVAVDAIGPDGAPSTAREYNIQGAPTTLLIDRTGRLRLQRFGVLDDIRLGAYLNALMMEPIEALEDLAEPRLGSTRR